MIFFLLPFIKLLVGTRDGRTQSARAWLFFSLHLDGLKTPIYTQTIVKWRWKKHNPNPHSTLHPKPIPKKPKNLKLNTLFLIYWYLPRKPNFRSHASPIRSRHSWVSGLRQTDAAPFFCCCRVAAFGSQDLSFRISINGHWASGSRVSGPRYSALRTWVSRPRQARARTQRTPGVSGPGPAKTGSSPRSSAAGHERDPVLSGRAQSSVCDRPELRHGRTDRQGTLYITSG